MSRVLLFQAETQTPDHVSISAPALLFILILIGVVVAAYRDQKLANALVTACAVGGLLVFVLVV